jgi:hypothetical protein
VTVDTAEQLEQIAWLNAQLEQELAVVLLGPFALQRTRLVHGLSITALLLTAWNAFTLIRGFGF